MNDFCVKICTVHTMEDENVCQNMVVSRFVCNEVFFYIKIRQEMFQFLTPQRQYQNRIGIQCWNCVHEYKHKLDLL